MSRDDDWCWGPVTAEPTPDGGVALQCTDWRDEAETQPCDYVAHAGGMVSATVKAALHARTH